LWRSLEGTAHLAEMLANHSEVAICGEAADGISAFEAIKCLNPDILFFDLPDFPLIPQFHRSPPFFHRSPDFALQKL
jgi:hypothetical protein